MASPERRAALAGDQAARRGRKLPPEVQADADAAHEKRQEQNLDHPKTQWAIENPKTLKTTLELGEHGSHAITIRTVWSYHDVFDLGILEDLESLVYVVQSAMRRHSIEVGDNAFILTNPRELLDVVMLPRIRKPARELLAKISKYDVPWQSEHTTTDPKTGAETPFTVKHAIPTPDEFLVGFTDRGEEFAGIVTFLCGLYRTEVEQRKNSRKTTATRTV